MGKFRIGIAAAFIVAVVAVQSRGSIIDFTGGTVTRFSAPFTPVTAGAVSYDDVDYYEEAGFKLDFLPNSGSGGFATHVGTYYFDGPTNDVIHSHWATGSFGGVMTVDITEGGTPFDLNYFVLTSNTSTGGGFASGSELAYVQAYADLGATTPIGSAVLLPSNDWGFSTSGPFPGTGGGVSTIFLGSDFDAAVLVRFYVTSTVDCFGMDEFYINEPAPGGVPEPASILAWTLLGALGVIAAKRRGRTA